MSLSKAHPDAHKTKIVTEVLKQSGHFSKYDIQKLLPDSNMGTIGSCVGMLRQAKIITAVSSKHGRPTMFEVTRHTTPVRAITSMNLVYSRRMGRPRRRNSPTGRSPSLKRQRPDSSALSQIKLAIEKAKIYDQLLAYLNITDEYVRAQIS